MTSKHGTGHYRILFYLAWLAIAPSAYAADPQPYKVDMASTSDRSLVEAISTL